MSYQCLKDVLKSLVYDNKKDKVSCYTCSYWEELRPEAHFCSCCQSIYNGSQTPAIWSCVAGSIMGTKEEVSHVVVEENTEEIISLTLHNSHEAYKILNNIVLCVIDFYSKQTNGNEVKINKLSVMENGYLISNTSGDATLITIKHGE